MAQSWTERTGLWVLNNEMGSDGRWCVRKQGDFLYRVREMISGEKKKKKFTGDARTAIQRNLKITDR